VHGLEFECGEMLSRMFPKNKDELERKDDALRRECDTNIVNEICANGNTTQALFIVMFRDRL